jgi:hypothetical protein
MCDRLKQPDPYSHDEEDGGPAITQTVEGLDFIWDGCRWREMVDLSDALKDPPRQRH